MESLTGIYLARTPRARPRVRPQTITGPKIAAGIFRGAGLLQEQEVVMGLALTQGCVQVGPPWVVSVGTLGFSMVHPRDVFREVIRRNACAVILAHNHPSGDATPSENDRQVATSMVLAAELLGLLFLDSLVLVPDDVRSLAENFPTVFTRTHETLAGYQS